VGGRSVEDSGKPTAENNRETAAIDENGEPPGANATLAERRAYWRRRQDALPTNKIVDDLEPHEIEFYEEFTRAGNDIELIPKDKQEFKSTNDFIWTNNGGIEVELKSTANKYATIRENISKSVKKARESNGSSKERFIVNLGRNPLTIKLRRQLSLYNLRNPLNPIGCLWVWTEGGLTEITLE